MANALSVTVTTRPRSAAPRNPALSNRRRVTAPSIMASAMPTASTMVAAITRGMMSASRPLTERVRSNPRTSAHSITVSSTIVHCTAHATSAVGS